MLVVLRMVVLVLLLREAQAARMGAGKEEIKQSKEHDAAHELTNENFNETLWTAPTTWAIVEFYAHWCPACRNFKPHYERVAHLFNGPQAAHPGIVYMANVDCANQINQKLCQRFSIQAYPTLYWGTPSALAWGSAPLVGNNLEVIKNGRTADALLHWINEHIGKSYSFTDVAEGGQILTESAKMVASMHDIEEATAKAYEIILENKLVSAKHRPPFVKFLQLLSVHHPSKRCRVGSADILVNLKEIWPSESILEGGVDSREAVGNVEALRKFHICGNMLPRGIWKNCRSESGYSCGLWFLLHALSVRVDDVESNYAFRAMRDFIGNFFICEECREHFLSMSSSATDKVFSRRLLAMWLWQAHNEVSKRVAKEITGIELTSKKLWPPIEVCASCRKAVKESNDGVLWDEGKVYSFLVEAYGRSVDADSAPEVTIEHSNAAHLEVGGNEESSSSNSVAVPVGAAAGIAMASCGFGIVACCWRVQQKKRKQMRRRN